ncbi:hypothetical protein GCM10010503_37800 [Streptomyces lucensis JCM 4490]|uniref:50S ribosomal protein L31 n=1 Tax=Streptomyces lucensis JCM 4490 TaxID=1306176 RepID=A0A918JA39_9ACTN|nr:hypothetical protein GCM10010503_37800 [Streptomyces lucensis JCM 4490]
MTADGLPVQEQPAPPGRADARGRPRPPGPLPQWLPSLARHRLRRCPGRDRLGKNHGRGSDCGAPAPRHLLTRSTIDTRQTLQREDGITYPVVDVETSSASHPFYTGNARVVDTTGRVKRFERCYGRTPSARH